MKFALAGAACLLAVALAQAQTDSAEPPQFEVAVIKPSPSQYPGSTFYNPTPDRFRFDNVTVKELIAYAWGVRQFQIEGASGWVNSDRYDILAKPDGPITGDNPGEMVQNLLADRMNLKVHEDTKDMSVFALVASKGGAKLRESSGRGETIAHNGYGHMMGRHLTMENLTSMLAAQVERPVIDKTGITGQFDVRLDWVPDDSPETGPSIFTAVQEQLGLKLESERAPVETVVIDHVDRPSDN